MFSFYIMEITLRTIIAFLAICQLVRTQVLNTATGMVTPMIVQDTTSNNMAFLCVDEDPDTGDRVFGGQGSTGPFLGFKDGADTANLNDPTNWKWKLSDTTMPGGAMISCKFTPLAYASHDNSKLIATISGFFNTNGVFATLWHPKKPGQTTAVISMPHSKFSSQALVLDKQASVPAGSFMISTGTELQWFICYLDAGSKYLWHKTINVGAYPATVTSTKRTKLNNVWGQEQNMYPELLVLPDKSKMFINIGTPIGAGTTGTMINCIWRLSMPINLDNLVTGGEKQYCNTHVGPVCSGDAASNRWCIVRALGPLAYFDKLVTIQYWRIAAGPVPYSYDMRDFNFIGQCAAGSDVFYKINFVLWYSQNTIPLMKAVNSTSNYIFIQTGYTKTSPYGYNYVVHVHFDPDTANCATFAFKTPPRVEVTHAKQLLKDGTLIMTWTNQFVTFSEKLKGFLYVGYSVQFETGVAWNTAFQKGYAHAILLSETDWFDYNVTIALTGNAFNYTTAVTHFITPEVPTETTQAPTLGTYNFYPQNSSVISSCYQSFRQNKQSKYKPGLNYTLQLGLNGATPQSVILLSDLFVMPTDPTCQPGINGASYEAPYQFASYFALTVNATHAFFSSTSVYPQYPFSIKLYTSYLHAYSHSFNISTVLHECAIAPSAPAKAYTMPTSITKYKIDGTSAPAGPEEFGNQTFNLIDMGYIVYAPNRTNCQLTLEFNSIQNVSSGAALANTVGLQNYYLNSSSGNITFFNYTTQLDGSFINSRINIYAKNAYVNTYMSIVTVSAGAHVCNTQTIVYNASAKINDLTLNYYMDYVDFETPPKMVMIGSGASNMTVNVTEFVSSNNPLCPIKQIEIGKVLDKSNVVVNPIPTWIKWDNITKLITFSDFGVQQPGAIFSTFLNVTTFYQFLQPPQYVGKVIFNPDNCTAMAFNKNFSHEAYIFTNTWETETGEQVINKQMTVPVITIDITSKPPISSVNETLCPTVAFSMTNATLPNGTIAAKTFWEDKVSLKDKTITVQNYGSINITEWYNLWFSVRSRTKNAISFEQQVFRTWAYNFKCTTDKIIAYAPEVVKLVNVTYNTIVPLTGDPKPDTNISDVIVDMSTGFMDRIAEKNCSLSNLQLTKVLFANGTEVVKSLWSSLFLFDSAKKQLTITKYAGLSTTDFNQTRLLFQAKITDDLPALTKAWHFINVTVNEVKVKEVKPVVPVIAENTTEVKPAQFASPLQPIYVTQDFSKQGNVTFQLIKYKLPDVKDPGGLKVKSITITNLASAKFVSWNAETNTVTVDPNLIPKAKYDAMVKLNLKLDNGEKTKVYDLAIVITNTAKKDDKPAKAVKDTKNSTTLSKNSTASNTNQTKSATNLTNSLNNDPTNLNDNSTDSADNSTDSASNSTNSADNSSNSTEEAKTDDKSTSGSGSSATGNIFVPNFQNKDSKNEDKKPDIFEEEEQVWVRPPEPPQLRLVTLGSKGDLKLDFSQAIVFPPEFFKILEEDKKFLANLEQGNKVDGTQRRMLKGGASGVSAGGGSFFDFQIEGAVNKKKQPISLENIYITELTDSSIQIKIKFENPELISMSDQSVQDRLVVGLGLVKLNGQNGLPFNNDNLEKDEKGHPINMNDVQPMVDENASEVQTLETTSDTIFDAGFIMMAIQFAVTLVLSVGLSFFWDLINSQINFIYLPLLRVNAPGQVSFYLEVLIFVCTFDPIPMNILYEVIPVFTFDAVSNPTDRSVFGRIGIEDRNIVTVLGSLILFIAFFILTQGVYLTLLPLKQKSKWIRKILPFVAPSATYRTIVMIFLLETYLDLTLGGLINTENDYLLDDPANWGPRGNLTKSDQFSIVLGNIIHISTVVFPFVVMVVIDWKYQNRYANRYKVAEYDFVYECMYEGLRVDVIGPLHYQSLNLLRKLFFAFIVFYLHEEVFTLFQVMANALISFSFAFYIGKMEPFIETTTNRVQLLNEFTYYFVSVIYLTFTDFNPDPEIKIYTGWLVVIVAILNLLYPNLTTMLAGVIPEIKEAIFGPKGKIATMKNRKGLKNFEKFRKQFIEKKKLKLKKEFMEKESITLKKHPRKSQVADVSYFIETAKVLNVYKAKEEKLKEQRQVKHYVPEDEIFEVDINSPLGVISEHSSSDEETNKEPSIEESLSEYK